MVISRCFSKVLRTRKWDFGKMIGSWGHDSHQWIHIMVSLQLNAMLEGETWTKEVDYLGYGLEKYYLSLFPSLMSLEPGD